MKIQVHGAPLYAYTSGKPIDPAKPTVVFIHGVLNDHSVWILQSRYFAHHGWNVLAIDLPGQGKSGGQPPESVEHAADTVIALLENSVKAPEKAIHMVNVFSHSTLCPPPSALGPGTWLYGGSRALMRRMLASNAETNVFYTGFKACNDYASGEQAMAAVHCPTLFLVGRHDQMTPPKAAKALAAHARLAKIVEVNAGHALMTEAPDEVLFALRDFLAE